MSSSEMDILTWKATPKISLLSRYRSNWLANFDGLTRNAPGIFAHSTNTQ
jgi:hypothetical protein